MENIEIKVGEVRTLVLEGRGTAGYGWTATVEDEAVATVRRTGTVPSQRPAGQTGSRDESFAVTGIAPGSTAVHFILARPWEKGNKPLATRDFEVVVSGQAN